MGLDDDKWAHMGWQQWSALCTRHPRRRGAACAWGQDCSSLPASTQANSALHRIVGSCAEQLFSSTTLQQKTPCPPAPVVAASALLKIFDSTLFSAGFNSVFYSCRVYSHCEVLDCTMNKWMLHLHLLPCVLLIPWTLCSDLAPSGRCHALLKSSVVVFCILLVSFGLVCVSKYSLCWRSFLCVFLSSLVADASRCNAAGALSVALHMGSILLCQSLHLWLCLPSLAIAA